MVLSLSSSAIAAVIALVLVIPPLISLIPGTIANHIHGYLPTVAGQLVAQTSQQPADVLSPWQGFGVFCLWTAVLLAAFIAMSVAWRLPPVLDALARGRTNRQIGAELGLSESAVKAQVHGLLSRTGCVSRAQLVARAYEWGVTGS